MKTIQIKEDKIYAAHFVLEADTPLAVGSGEKGLLVDRLIARDANGLPYIPGSSIAGVLRHHLEHALSRDEINKIFGFQGPSEQENADGEGSRIIVSAAHLVDKDGQQIIEGLKLVDWKDPYYRLFEQLPNRDHVRITDRGAADVKGHGKFDEELVHKGTRFAFMIELHGTEEDSDNWKEIMETLQVRSFRLGAGTRKGFGKLKFCNIHQRVFNLRNIADLTAYLEEENSLDKSFEGWEKLKLNASNELTGYHHYEVRLKPESFFHFGAGYGDEDVDMQPKKEKVITWESGSAVLSEDEYYLIPATSVKGALSHRTAYYYNHLAEYNLSNAAVKASKSVPEIDSESVLKAYLLEINEEMKNLPDDSSSRKWEELAQKIEQLNKEALLKSELWSKKERVLGALKKQKEEGVESALWVGEKNEAVKSLFGYAKGKEPSDKQDSGQRGRVILEDVFIPKEKVTNKVFSHVAIDRFTGGAIDGALYQEKVIEIDEITINIYVEESAFSGDKGEKVKNAFEKTLNDLISGKLQLGGNTTKGHGAFSGSLESKTA